jgi:hypothetical protein
VQRVLHLPLRYTGLEVIWRKKAIEGSADDFALDVPEELLGAYVPTLHEAVPVGHEHGAVG